MFPSWWPIPPIKRRKPRPKDIDGVGGAAGAGGK